MSRKNDYAPDSLLHPNITHKNISRSDEESFRVAGWTLVLLLETLATKMYKVSDVHVSGQFNSQIDYVFALSWRTARRYLTYVPVCYPKYITLHAEPSEIEGSEVHDRRSPMSYVLGASVSFAEYRFSDKQLFSTNQNYTPVRSVRIPICEFSFPEKFPWVRYDCSKVSQYACLRK
jgi:hypothetical protein